MNSPALHVVRSTSPVESGFIAAGVTVSIVAIINSFGAILSLIGFL